MAKKNFLGGRLTQYQSSLNSLKEGGATFKVISGGQTRKIVHSDSSGEVLKKTTFYGYGDADNLRGVHIVRMVKKDIDNYIEEGYPIPETKFKPNLTLYNLNRIKQLSEAKDSEKEMVYCIDINSCYFQTAYNLGFITKELYEKAWKDRKINKIGLLASIGSLNKKNVIYDYENGVLVNKSYDLETYNRYSPFYWAIIKEVYSLMLDISHNLKDDFYMWLTDCAYIKMSRAEEVKEYLKMNGYDYKHFFVEFNGIDNQTIRWYDYGKGTQKYIHYHKRLGFDPSVLTD